MTVRKIVLLAGAGMVLFAGALEVFSVPSVLPPKQKEEAQAKEPFEASSPAERAQPSTLETNTPQFGNDIATGEGGAKEPLAAPSFPKPVHSSVESGRPPSPGAISDQGSAPQPSPSTTLALGTLAARLSAPKKGSASRPSQPQRSAESERIVSLSPIATEVLFALGAGDQVVGVTRYCDKPSKALQLPKIGGVLDPQLELVLDKRPTLVVATPMGTMRVLELIRARVPTLEMPVESLGDLRRFVLALGQKIDRLEEAELVIAGFDEQLLRWHHRLAKEQPSLLFLVGTAPMVAAGPGTYLHEITEWLGGKLPLPASTPPWPQISIETLLGHPPDVVIATEGTTGKAALLRELAPLIDRKGTRVLVPSAPLFQRPSLDVAEDMRTLLQLLGGA